MTEEIIASQIFQQYGLEFKTAVRAGGWTNAVWFNGDLVLRVSLVKDSVRIRHEIQLSQFLPAAVGYPVNVSYGVIDGFEWSISKRITGKNLSDTWPHLTWAERTICVRQIWDIIQAVHTADIEKADELSARSPWYSTLNADVILNKLKHYAENGIFTSEQFTALSDILQRFWNRFNKSMLVLNHGDITMDNILWNDGQIVSLMDFEHSVIAPAEIDLNSFIRLAFFEDEEGIAQLTENTDAEFQKYKYEVSKLIRPSLNRPDCIGLLYGFDVLFQMRFLDFWLENPEGSISKSEAYVKLVSYTDKHGCYLSKVLNFATQVK